MSILWADSFNTYGLNNDLLLDGLYAETGRANPGVLSSQRNQLIADPDPLSSSIVWRMGRETSSVNYANEQPRLRRVFPSGMTEGGVALRVWFPNLPTQNLRSASLPITFTTSDLSQLINVEVDPSGRLIVWRGTFPITADIINRQTILGTTANPVIASNSWQHIEVKAKFHSSDGYVQIRVQGIEVLNIAGVNTSPTDSDAFNWMAINYNNTSAVNTPPPYFFIKDLIAWDVNGSYNNDFLGTVKLEKLDTEADMTLGDWNLQGGATGWEILSNTPPIDTDYIYADPADLAQAEFDLQPVSDDVSSVRAAIVVLRGQKSDAGDGSVKIGIKRESSESLSGDIPLTTAMTYYLRVFETDPVTGLPITPTQMNDMKVVIDRTL